MGRRQSQYITKPERRRRGASDGLSFNNQKKRKVNMARVREVSLWIGEILLVNIVAALLVYFLGVRVPMVGQSMSGTLENGDTVLVNRFTYQLFQPKPNDIIVFLPNGNVKSHYYIKRVIAVPGDTVQVIKGRVIVNGKPFAEEIDAPYVEDGLLATEPIEVGEDEYFVLGDNRGNGEDSRYANIGNVKKEHILGKAWFIISPWEKFGWVK